MLLPNSSHSFLWDPSSLRQSQTVTFEPQLIKIMEVNKITPRNIKVFFMSFCVVATFFEFENNCAFLQ